MEANEACIAGTGAPEAQGAADAPKRKFGAGPMIKAAIVAALVIWAIVLAVLMFSGSNITVTSSADGPYDASQVTNGLFILTQDGLCYKANTDGQTFSGTTTSSDPSRIIYSVGGTKRIPVLYADDVLAYFSTSSVPTTFNVERFADAGWTVGLKGVSSSLTFSSGSIISGSEISGILTSSYVSSSDTITIVEIGGEEATADEFTSAGTIYGLSQGDEIQIGVMKGTFYSTLTATADTRIWYSAETYSAGCEATKDGYVRLTLPEGLEGSYISVGGTGLMYVSPDSRPAEEE